MQRSLPIQWSSQSMSRSDRARNQTSQQLASPDKTKMYLNEPGALGSGDNLACNDPLVREEHENSSASVWDDLERVASENAVVMFSISSCCICHVVKRLFSSLGVGPVIYELDREASGPEISLALQRLAGTSQALPAVFIGRKYVGGLDELIAAHIVGALVPQLKQAGALWL